MRNILFDIGHPAQFHLFKNFISYLKEKGYNVFVTTRNKDITNTLLDHYDINYTCVSNPSKNNFVGMLSELIIRDVRILIFCLKHKIKIGFGTSTSIAHLTLFSLGLFKSYNFGEDDDFIVPLHTYSTYPFTTKIVNPKCLKFKLWKHKRVLYHSYHELAYLHPKNFTPNENVIKKYGLKKRRYVIFRLSALNAHHDAGAKGISTQLKLQMTKILKGYDIVESFEGKRGNKIAPWDMHHILASAKMIISDSQTMTIEAAVLGVPSMRINTFIGKSTVIEELENKYKLCFGILPANEGLIMKVLKELINNPNIESDWQLKLKKLIQDKIDFNQWMIEYFESEIKQLID
jgi:uncharacterized protein